MRFDALLHLSYTNHFYFLLLHFLFFLSFFFHFWRNETGPQAPWLRHWRRNVNALNKFVNCLIKYESEAITPISPASLYKNQDINILEIFKHQRNIIYTTRDDILWRDEATLRRYKCCFIRKRSLLRYLTMPQDIT